MGNITIRVKTMENKMKDVINYACMNIFKYPSCGCVVKFERRNETILNRITLKRGKQCDSDLHNEISIRDFEIELDENYVEVDVIEYMRRRRKEA